MATVLVVNFFPAFTPPSSGGEMRLVSIYRALSKTHDIVMLTSTDFGARFEEIVHTPRLRELRFPKDNLWRTAYATLERIGVSGDLAGLAFALAVNNPSCELRMHARRLAAAADIVIHEFPFSEPIFNDGCPCREIYNSHNFELSLLSSIVRGAGFDETLLKLMRLEANLVARVQRVFATSEADAEKFRLFYGAPPEKISICPNGFDEQALVPVVAARNARTFPLPGPATLLFIGSAHYPNIDAARFLVELAVELPECKIVLAGGLCNVISQSTIPSNLVLIGYVEPSVKLGLLAKVDLFLNPVVLGSGTSLKALEALGSGIPMVSTPEGVRGLGLLGGIDCEIVARTEFATTIRKLLLDKSKCAALAAAGLAKASSHYSWDRIAHSLDKALFRHGTDSISGASGNRPFVLALNDYPVLEPGSGGIARVRNLLMHLDSDVVLVSFGRSCEMALIAPGVLHVTIPKTPAHDAFQETVNQGQSMSVNDAVASLFVGSNRVLGEIVSTLALRASVVIFEHPYMSAVLDTILAVRPDLPVIYSSHNVEATHKAELLQGHRIADALSTFIAELERRLVQRAQLIVCCTESDAEHFEAEGVPTILVPNGCTLPDEEVLRAARNDKSESAVSRIGFLGSSHGPNVTAAEFIVRDLAPAFPDATFEMVGSVCTALTMPLPRNVVLHGLVTESKKTAILANWHIALNPIESGGGSSLKLADYMAHGLFTLNTAAGARGFAIEENDVGWIVERQNFCSTLGQVIASRDTVTRQGVNAHDYAARELSWKAVTAQYRDKLRALSKSPQQRFTQRLLVVTYRYTEPSLGGAEEYLIEILKRMRPRFGKVDLAAIDVDHITNEHHFGCRVSSPNGGASSRLAELFDRSMYFKADELGDSEVIARARNLERAWTREERSLLAPFAAYLAIPDRLRMFGGFFWPENHGGVVRRWTSPMFSFLLPLRTCSFRIAGYAASDKTLRMSLMTIDATGDAQVIAQHRQRIEPHFDVSVSLPPNESAGESLLLCFEVDEHQAVGDHRPFGVLLEAASTLSYRPGALDSPEHGMSSLVVSSADLSEEIEDELRITQFEKWVTALFDIANRRDGAMDAAFSAVRGPHSSAMQFWLANHASEYDCILVQGIPFDVIPSTVETLKRLSTGPQVVTLPHFHGDDRFYHWNRFFNSFASADENLLFSSSIAAQLRECGKFTVVPGGGVRADEHGDVSAKRAFESVHPTGRQFFLSLGRKTASKGYEQTIRAHQQMRNSGIPIDLVLIGPDEDGRQVTAEGVYYLGRQPREVIRGALGACLGLITMSRSESFGIVLCEAWLFGKPVIANRSCYSFRELIRDGESGLLVTTDAELTAAMTRLASEPAERDSMGQSGFHDVLTRFTWESVADACYAALVPQNGSEPIPYQAVSPFKPESEGVQSAYPPYLALY